MASSENGQKVVDAEGGATSDLIFGYHVLIPETRLVNSQQDVVVENEKALFI